MSMKALENGKVVITSLRDGNNMKVCKSGDVYFTNKDEGIR